jgi:hypothetical protein
VSPRNGEPSTSGLVTSIFFCGQLRRSYVSAETRSASTDELDVRTLRWRFICSPPPLAARGASFGSAWIRCEIARVLFLRLCGLGSCAIVNGSGVSAGVVTGIQMLTRFATFDVDDTTQGQTSDIDGNPLPASHATAE